MAARIIRYASRAQLLKLDRAAEARQLMLGFEAEAPRLVSQALALIDRHTIAEKGWSFVMLSPAQNRTVIRWIQANAKRPKISIALWSEFFCHMRTDTGEIVMSRSEMAEAVGALPRDVSAALTELHDVGALIRHQEGREVRWFMNPRIGTCLTGAAREKAQKASPALRVLGSE